MNNISRKSKSNAMPRQPHHYPGLRIWAALAVLVAVLASCGADRNFKKGEKFLALGEYFDAAAQYKQAYSKSKPKDRTARGLYAMRMAYCYNRINSNGKAIAAYRNAIRYGADSLQTHLDFARALLKDANYKEAEKEFLLVLDSMPDNQLAKDGLQSDRKSVV